MIKMLKDWKYSSNGVNCVCLKAGDSVEGVKADILADWLARGICGEEPKIIPKKEVKIMQPVEEIKAEPKKKRRRQ
jgi:hypothetical protein